VTYINALQNWSPEADLAKSLAMPPYAANTAYRYLNIAFWLPSGPADSALIF